MPSPRKRIGFLPSEEVHEIIEKLCRTSDYSQSKVTGLLVEEALRSRGVLDESLSNKAFHVDDLQIVEKFFKTLQSKFVEVFHPILITTRSYKKN